MNRPSKNSFHTSSRSSLLADTDDHQSSPNSSFSHAQSSFLYSEVSLEMIDDFLNPLSSRKPHELKTTNLLNIKSATGGLGIKSKASCDSLASSTSHKKGEYQFKPDGYLPFSVSREKNNNFDYAKQRHNFPHKYYEHGDSQSQVGSILRDEMSSVVGSGMSQIESVSAMSTSTNKKHTLFNQIKRLDHLDIEEDEEEIMSDLNNNLNSKVNRIFDQSQELEKTFTEAEERQNRLEEILKVYKLRHDFDPKLPITERKDEIIDLIENNRSGTQFCIVQGGTGCGKTTQIPQYILDHYMKEKKYCNIIVTQPRRIAAISISKRVCIERSWDHGSFCGYQIGLDRSKISEDTRITYCTTGVLLQKLIGPKADENFNSTYTHILLDEVHERDLDTDFVMLLIKLKSFGRLNAKVVLMSATLNIKVFSEYFGTQLKNNLSVKYVDGRIGEFIHAPCIEIKSKMYDISEFYWNQLTGSDSFLIPIFNQIYNEHKFKNKNQHVKSRKNVLTHCDSFRQLMSLISNMEFSDSTYPDMYPECMFMVIALLVYFDCKENEQIRQSNNAISEDSDDEFQTVNQKPRFIDGLPEVRGSVLIFVPGMEHIKQLQQLISEELPSKKLNILPLHSDIVISQQNKVFEKSAPTWRKVIISTSIAESSITVPDVKYVIDFCLTKELYCDPSTNYTHLRLEWASISNLNQRRGRSGRVSEGFCYRLVPQPFLSTFSQFAVPAILREPLHRVILNVKRLERKEEPKQILAMAIQPPKLLDIERTVLLLKECGALSLRKNSAFDGDLTYAGRIMANLPIDVRLSKLILLGHAFGKLRETIIIAAGLSTKTFFTCFYKSHLESFKAKWTWSDEWMCDCITLLNAYNLYESQVRNRTFERPGDAESWARKNMIEIVRIREVEKLVIELTSRLRSLGIMCNRHVRLDGLATNVKSDVYEIDDNEELVKNNLIIKMIMAGAFYPNYFTSTNIDLQEAVRMCNGKDFRNTVQLRNFPRDEGVLYTQKICDMFKVCSKLVKASFQDTKCFVEFNSSQVTSGVNLGVYLAVQMRLLSIPLRIKRYNAKITYQKLKRHNQLKSISSSTLSQTLDTTRNSKVKSLSHLDSTISETASTTSDKTAINSEDEEERGKFLDPERYIIEKGQEFMSYQTIQKRFDRTLNISVHSAIYDTDQSLVARLSDPKFLFPAKVDELKSVEVLVTDVIECAHFWVQIVNQERSDDLSFIHQELNIDYELKKMDCEHIHQDSLCVSHYDDSSIGKAFYRAKVLEVYPAKLKAEIIFIDYGNKVTRKFQDLFYLADYLKEYQFQAIECKMVNVRPSIFHNPTGQWTKASNQTFNRLVNDNKFVSFEIVLHGLDQNLAYVNLHGVTKSGIHKDFTELLVESGCAEIMSKTEIDLNLSKQYNRKDFYIPSRESDYMPSRPRYFNEDMAIRQAEQSKNKYYHEQSMLSDQDDLKSTVSTNHSSLNSVQEDDFDENDQASYDGYIEIRGPYSPLECNYTSLLNIGQNKKIKVERDSINYVTLDTDPTNDSCRLLLAHEVTLNQMGNTMILRKTSLMPKLPGLPTICTLLFAPSIELRTDHNETMFTGALCGLGFDEQNSMPIYTDNDIELAFDVQIDVNDIIMINSVRMAINMVIGSEQEVQTWTNDEKNLRILQQKACEKLLRLFLRNRTKIQPTYYSKPHRWNQIRKEDLIDPLNQDISMQNKEMYYTYHKVANWNEDDY